MLHALLHGKLDPNVAEPERREDALTSTVFGTLVLLEAWEVIGRWLKVAEWQTEGHELECWFWPRLTGGVEPDVVLRIGPFVAVVEAKYRSGRRGPSLDQVDNERPVDRIVRQHRAVSPPTIAGVRILICSNVRFASAGFYRCSWSTPVEFAALVGSTLSQSTPPSQGCPGQPRDVAGTVRAPIGALILAFAMGYGLEGVPARMRLGELSRRQAGSRGRGASGRGREVEALRQSTCLSGIQARSLRLGIRVGNP